MFFAFLIMIMVDEQQRFWISFGFWGATSGRLGASSGPLRGVLGRLGSVLGRLGGALGASWDVLGGKTVLVPSWSRFGAVLEASWRRLGDVLGRLGSVMGAPCGPLRGFLGRLLWLLERLGVSRRHLVCDFHTRKWLHDLQNYVKYDSRLGTTYKSNKIAFRS